MMFNKSYSCNQYTSTTSEAGFSSSQNTCKGQMNILNADNLRKVSALFIIISIIIILVLQNFII